MLKEGNNNNQVTAVVKKIHDAYKVNGLEGVLSHRMKRDIIDGFEVIINKETVDQQVTQRNFAHGDMFGFDCYASTGEGKPKESNIRTHVFKRALETTYKLKGNDSRKLLSVIENNFYSFPFSLNQFDNEENITMKTDIVKKKT